MNVGSVEIMKIQYINEIESTGQKSPACEACGDDNKAGHSHTCTCGSKTCVERNIKILQRNLANTQTPQTLLSISGLPKKPYLPAEETFCHVQSAPISLLTT